MNIYRYLLFLSLALFCCACEDVDGDYSKIQSYELPHECNLKIEENKVVYVENMKEFEYLFDGYTKVPRVNFKNSKLLLVKGKACQGVQEIKKQLTKIDEGYELVIEVYLNLTMKITPWCIGYIIPRTEEMGYVNLKIDYIDFQGKN